MQPLNHETYIHKVRDLVLPLCPADKADKLRRCKLAYGFGTGRYRGITYYDAWSCGSDKAEFVEIAATGEESPVQLAGTTIHELAHVLAGYGQGHGLQWKEACHALGLRRVHAAGTVYRLANFHPSIRESIAQLIQSLYAEKPALIAARGIVYKPGPCPLGIGTRGGKSRGTGSGSRLRLYQCQCEKPIKIRHAGDELNATCNVCGTLFARQGD